MIIDIKKGFSVPYSTKHSRDKTFAVGSPCEYSRKNFRGCIKNFLYPCDCIRKFVGKTFAVQGKTAKSANVLSLECFGLYGIVILPTQLITLF